MSRRQSVIDEYAIVEARIRHTIGALSELWDEVSMSESMRIKRVSTAFRHITDMCDEMLENESAMVNSLKESVGKNSKLVEKMRSELGLEPLEIDEHTVPPHSIALMRLLEDEVKMLEERYEEARKGQNELLEKLHYLAVRLGTEDVSLDQEPDMLFPSGIQQKYEAQREEWQHLLDKRIKKARKMQNDLFAWKQCEAVRKSVATDSDLQALVDCDLSSVDVCLSSEFVERFSTYHQELKPLYDQWLEHAEFRWTEKWREVCELWDKCHVGDSERQFHEQFVPGRNTEEDFAALSKECDRLEVMYDHCKPVYEKLDKWKDEWKERTEIEDRRKDPAYYQSRGKGLNVMRDSKRECELMRLLPKTYSELCAAYETYLEQYPGQEIRIEGMTPMAYCQWVQDEYNRDKEIERVNKLEAKKQELEASRMVYSPRTPASAKRNRHMFRTPASTSKMEPLAKRLAFESTLPPCRSPSTSDLLSIITPVRSNQAGPKHSSPKEEKVPQSPRSRAGTPSGKKPLSSRNIHF